MNSEYYSLDLIVEKLDKHKQRATYGAVAGVLRKLPISLMKGYEKCPRYSWIVSEKTDRPTDYTVEQLHPELDSKTFTIKTSKKLIEWLMKNP